MGGRSFGERKYHARRARMYIKEKPVKVGEEYDVAIAGVGARGDAFTRIQNFIVFVPGAKERDMLRIKIRDVREKFALAEILGVSKKPEKTVVEEEVEAPPEEPMEEPAGEEAPSQTEEQTEEAQKE